jgi:hypothetical protein
MSLWNAAPTINLGDTKYLFCVRRNCSAAMRIAIQFALVLRARNLSAHGQHFRQVTIPIGAQPAMDRSRSYQL